MKYYIVFILLLLCIRLNGQTDTSKFVYHKPLFDFNYENPVFILKNEQLSNKNGFLRFFALSGYREGVQQISGQFGLNFNYYENPKSGLQRFIMYNLSIVEMLTRGLVKGQTKIILEVKDPSKYDYDQKYGDKDNWMRKNAYCYELYLPVGIPIDPIINAHFAELFHVKFGSEKRLEKTLVLVRTSNKEKFKSKGKGEIINDLKNGRYINNDFSGVRASLQRFGNSFYFKDETGYPPESGYKIDMELNISDWTNLQTVRQALHHYDLDLRERMMEQEVYVIKELK